MVRKKPNELKTFVPVVSIHQILKYPELQLCPKISYSFVIPSHIVSIFQGVSSGIIRGCGRQWIGALVNFIGFYVIGMPLGLSLLFKTPSKVAGRCYQKYTGACPDVRVV